ncbi:MAG TPA: hypothetical protein PK014_02635 [Thermoanaerobaculia bacterium]|nr:hypothetical protein [Thermoanaerobaculia bacterium]HUM28869.1 hypothetical protein [Thermoanaerobaculia bacterium]HXK67198.1 hypothetical protein [Thermoanaerobaculia bacterium]
MTIVRIAFLILCSALILSAASTPPDTLSYQGVLRDDQGHPLDGTYDMVFSFFTLDTGGDEILIDEHKVAGTGGVTVSAGFFTVALGSGNILDGSGDGEYLSLLEMIRNFSDIWLQVKVQSEMLMPRVRLHSSPFALNASSLAGRDPSEFLDISASSQTKHGPLSIDISTQSVALNVGSNMTGGIFGGYGPNSNTGIKGQAWGGTSNIGVHGYAALNPGNWAGYFEGDTYIKNSLALGTATPDANLDVHGSVKLLGDPSVRSFDTEYLAESDGWVQGYLYAYGISGGDLCWVQGTANGSWRLYAGSMYGGSTFTMPVRKGEVWVVHYTLDWGSCGKQLMWIPMGQGSGSRSSQKGVCQVSGLQVPSENAKHQRKQESELARDGKLEHESSHSEERYLNDPGSQSGQMVIRVSVDDPIHEGDVLVMNQDSSSGAYRIACLPEDRLIAGVAGDLANEDVNGLDPFYSEGRVPLLVGGVAKVRVDASYGAIQKGDLLVTSPTSGHAMRSDNPMAGTILGKAMESLANGTGLIQVLLMLR